MGHGVFFTKILKQGRRAREVAADEGILTVLDSIAPRESNELGGQRNRTDVSRLFERGASSYCPESDSPASAAP